ncbi:MAG: dihydroorotase [Butyrivibrio sp.]|jgi:dihydroorotase|nr:dihydroorotase [Butyrivibrio sp.]
MLLIKNGYVCDPASGAEGKKDLLIDEGRILRITDPEIHPEEKRKETQVMDCEGLVISAGLVDPHVHFRDPGQTYKEDILTGAAAAAKGGFTSVVMMGNTNPHMDHEETIRYVLEKGKRTGIHCYACGNITMEMAGQTLTDFRALMDAGAVLLTDDGKPVVKEKLMKDACLQAVELHKVLSLHEENPELITENGINAGEVAQKLGLTGSPRQAEISMVDRDIRIAEETGAELTIQHISAAQSVELIRQARARGVKIHAEAAPHHFTLTEQAVLKYGTLAKMNPPLRSEADRKAIIEGLADGTIEMIATDHAPHATAEKEKPFVQAPSGIIGLETAFSLGIRELVNPGYLTLMQLLQRMSSGPAGVYALPAGSVSEGASADLVIFDPAENWKLESLLSKASNTPFLGEKMPGVIHDTICSGKVVYHRY